MEVAAGLSNAEIAEVLFIAPGTVRSTSQDTPERVYPARATTASLVL